MSLRRHRRYSRYRDSGVEWLGEVPGHWQVQRLKYLATVNDEVLPESTDPSFEMSYVDISSVDSISGITSGETLAFDKAPSRARRIVREGDVIVSTVRTYLRAIAAIENPEPNLIVSTGFAVIRPRQLDSSFASYALRTPYFVERVVADSVGVSYPAINAGDLAGFPVAYPAIEEQRAIVAFLDRETAKIDALVAKKERLIDLLQEKRTALVTRTVTKGLDPGVPMKDSRVEWLGEIPAHWEVRRLGSSVVSVQNGVWGEEPNGVDDTPCVRVADFDRVANRVRLDDPTLRAIDSRLRQSRLLSAGDLLLEKSGGGEKQLVGAIVLYDHDVPAVCSNFIARLQVDECCEPRFLTYLHGVLYSLRVNARHIKQSTGIQNLDADGYLREAVGFPARTEQARIADWLDAETARVDALITKVRDAIDRLTELRTALISAAVTGKIDVREEAA